jgi:NAD(P)-dependent dehydrogenase (short-subunit alcohol dehydrogenase family)
MTGELAGKVALVAGAFVYATGRSSRVAGSSDMDRPETIEETADLIAVAGGDGTALRVDHLEVDEVRSLLDRVRGDHGRLDVLVNDILGGDRYAQWDKPTARARSTPTCVPAWGSSTTS